MKKILLLMFLMFSINLNGYAESKNETYCVESDLYDLTTCVLYPFKIQVTNKNTSSDTVEIGAIWSESNINVVDIYIRIGKMATDITQVEFDLDGAVRSFDIMSDTGEIVQRDGIPLSDGVILIPLNYLAKIVNNKAPKYKISTQSSGYRVGIFQEDITQNNSKALNEFYKRVIEEKTKQSVK
ncbi:hypothetical protein EC844_13014 [Acinetobacter calcoaceticus]|uniref:Uncharacterized protein n=1 Tax=Acinetobacter calcoaceticus TaxID=471 RepID=A0A4R1XBD7_ACICA|nr:hypothetical protein EC844_13014 [Acinetobacter calcoaceticus]